MKFGAIVKGYFEKTIKKNIRYFWNKISNIF